MDEVLIFQHIPKTGGITLSLLLLQHFPRDQVFHVRNPRPSKAPIFGNTWGTREQFAALSEQERSAFRCVIGHMPYGLHESIPHTCRYITLLRNPVEQVLSQHGQHNKMIQNREMEGRVLSLEEFLREKPNAVSNHQTRALLGRAFHGRSDSERFELVRSHFDDHYKLVGVLEKFDETILILNRLMEWPRVAYRRKNVGKRRLTQKKASPEIVDSLQKRNALDFRVYAYAHQLLDRAQASYGPTFDEDLRELRTANDSLEKRGFSRKLSSWAVQLLRRWRESPQ